MSQNLDTEAGFNILDPSGDEWVAGLRKKHDLPEPASLEQIEPVATRLLDNLATALDAAELVLNRRVDGKERFIICLIGTPGFTSRERFDLLLIERQTEEFMKKAGKTDFETT